MQLDPTDSLIVLLVLGGLAIFSLVYMVYYVWSIPRQPLAQLQRIVKNEKRVLQLIGGLIFGDMVFWFFRPSSAPLSEVVAALIFWNVWGFCEATAAIVGATR
jgi:uncharacterized membrane protein YdjX (TVP38/TMEM64 family)